MTGKLYTASISIWDMVLTRQTQVRFKQVNPRHGRYIIQCQAHGSTSGSADALNGIWEHISNGMYGGTVVHHLGEQPD